jgi:DNA-binding transcriptional LysR family regulator
VDLTDRFVDVVEEGVDLAVRIAVLADSSLVARRLAPARRVLCASPEYLARRGEPHAPADLAGHECIEYAHGDGRRWRFRGERGEETVTIAGRLRTNSGELMRAMAVAGQGIALLPTFLACDDLRAGRLRAVLGERLAGDTAVYAIFPHRRLLSAKVRLLVEHLAASLGPQPAWDEGLA